MKGSKRVSIVESENEMIKQKMNEIGEKFDLNHDGKIEKKEFIKGFM